MVISVLVVYDQICFSLIGYVALIVGTNEFGPAIEIYSPDGKCQHQLAHVPIDGTLFHLPAIAYINGKILSCGGHSDGEVSCQISA